MNPFVLKNLKFVLNEKKILIGITGSIAAFKICDLIRYLKDCGAHVRVVLSESAESFVAPLTLSILSENPVSTQESAFAQSALPPSQYSGHQHIELARWADALVIAPATANAIAKLALGISDNLLLTEALAFQGPLLIAPAMNPSMFSHSGVQINLKTLKDRGAKIVGPEPGVTSCGEQGIGRMTEPEILLERVAELFYQKNKSEKVLISLGPTRSYLDPIRYFTNQSSGQMGASLCWAARALGYGITAISGPTDFSLPHDVLVKRVTKAEEMAEAVMENLSRHQYYFACAAVMDWDIAHVAPKKLKKKDGVPELKFILNKDILEEVKIKKRNQKSRVFVLGFAAETEDFLKRGAEKLEKKDCDALFVNDVSQPSFGMDSDQNGGYYLTRGQGILLPVCSKPELARKITDLVFEK